MSAARTLPGYDLWLDDFKPGDAFTTDAITVTESMIVEFALHWDPQPIHSDTTHERTAELGGLMASGFLTLCIAFRLFLGSGVLAASNLSSPGFDKLRWLKPIRPGDTLHVVSRVLSTTPSRSRPDRGALLMTHEALNQRGETVLSCECTHFIRRRPSGGSAGIAH
jgi:acyl dehydratase